MRIAAGVNALLRRGKEIGNNVNNVNNVNTARLRRNHPHAVSL